MYPDSICMTLNDPYSYSWESFEKIFDLFITINGKETGLCFIQYCYTHNDSTEA